MRVFLAVLVSSAAFAQTHAAGPVTGMNNFIHATADLEKTTPFYMDVFGLPKPPPPRPPNPAVPGLINAPGAQLQVQVLRIPGAAFGWELTHFGGLDLKPGQASPSDPGAADFIVQVRDLNPVFADAKALGAGHLQVRTNTDTFDFNGE